MNKMRGHAGVTLLEVLVAVTIAGVVFVVLLSGFGTNIRTTATAEDYTIAAFLVKDVMTRLEVQKDIKAGTAEGEFGKDFPAYRWKTVIEKDPTLPYYRVTATVLFRRSGTERELAARTVILENEEQKK